MSHAADRCRMHLDTEQAAEPHEQVPAFTVAEFRARRSRYAVTIFVLNEGERIRAQLQKMRLIAEALDIVVVDGGSTDEGVERAYLASCGVRALLSNLDAAAISRSIDERFFYLLRNHR